jgi:hypothetical protein
MLTGQPFVRFRFRFVSDNWPVPRAGWAFDDFKIEPYRDVAVTAITRPASTELKRVNFQPQVTVTNNGEPGTEPETVDVVAEIWNVQQGLNEGFEGTTFPPTGWVRYDNDGGGAYWGRSTSYPRTGIASACSPDEGSNLRNDDWLVTPQISVQTGDTLRFWYRTGTVLNDTLEVWLSTTGNTITEFTVMLDAFGIRTTTYTEKVIPLNTYAGQNVYIAFVNKGLYNWGRIYIDDVTIGTDVVAPALVFCDTVFDLSVGSGKASAEVYFDPVALNTEGNYLFRSWTILPEDMYPFNDLMTRNFTVEVITLILIAPPNETLIHDNTPTFSWNEVTGAELYRIEVDNNDDFSSPEFAGTLGDLEIESDPLLDGLYYWHVRVESPGTADLYSEAWTLTIDTEGPVAPVLVSPADLATVNATPTFTWEAVSDAVNYNLVVDDGTKVEVINIETTELSYTPTTPLAELTHTWKVRAQNAASNWGDFQTPSYWSFTVDATPPAVPTTVSPTEGYVFLSETQTFEWNAVTDGAEYELSVDPVDDVYLTTATTYDLTLGAGSYTFKVRARDAVSNWSDYSAPVGFSVVLPAWVPADNVPAAPDLKVGKFVKDGGAMTTVSTTDDGDVIYMFPGNKSWQFYKYDDGVYTTLESIPYGVKPTDPLKINKKKIGKGAALCYDGTGIIYATKGNGTRELWAYDILTDTWVQKAFVPVPKALKGGTSIAYLDGILYLLAGGQKKTDLINFYSYDPLGDTLLGTPWTPLGLLTLGPNIKIWKDGACLTKLGGTLYALKSNDKYNPFFSYEVLTNAWTEFDSIPMVDSLAGKLKKVAVKDGGAMCASGDAIYAIKGGGTIYFWKYTTGGGWTRSDSIPRLDKKSVSKTGAALTYADGKVWLTKGNNRQELWRFNPLAEVARVNPTTVNAVMTVKTTTTPNFNITISPNPFTRLATINYTVPVSGKVTLKLYNAIGSLVETMNDGYVTAGTYTTRLNANTLAKGIYFLKYENNTNRAEIKLIVQ